MRSAERMPPNPVLVGQYLLGHRVEVKLRMTEEIAVVSGFGCSADRRRLHLILQEPGEYLSRERRWSSKGREWLRTADEIVRLTVLEGPPRQRIVEETDLAKWRKRRRRPTFSLDVLSERARRQIVG